MMQNKINELLAEIEELKKQNTKCSELLKENKTLKEENTEYKAQKNYGLVWENEKNKEKIVEDCKTKLPILERVTDKEIITDKKEPMNLMIEGDNYHALTCLNYTHKDKIDVIYIDPPYNKGKQNEWKYNDKYVDKEDRFRHSKWLNMMEKRLQLARNLLANDGVIFISIDDNEQANLKLLCDDIFGEQNFIASIIWQQFHTIKNDAKNFSKSVENIIVFSKNLENKNLIANEEFDKSKNYKFDDNDGKGKYKLDPLTAKSGNENNRKEFIFSNGIKWQPPSGRYWSYSFESLKNYEKENKIFFNSKNTPMFKRHLKDVREGRKVSNLWLGKNVGYSITGDKELKEIFENKKLFNNPKPTSLIAKILKITSDIDSTILDFFAGSGTTGHAVLQLNKEDGGSRKFILCTNNEGGIAEEVCYPRIQKVIEGYNKNGDGDKVEGLGGNLHYFKADEDSFIAVDSKDISDKQRLALTLKAGELIAIRENIFDEKEHSSHYQIFEDDTRQVAIYFTEYQVKLAELMEKLDKSKALVIYLFNWGKILLTGDDLGHSNITVKAIPEPIIKIYQEINK